MSRTLLEQWKDIAYDETADRGQLQNFWGSYFQIEKEIYEKLLSNPDEEVRGTVKVIQRAERVYNNPQRQEDRT